MYIDKVFFIYYVVTTTTTIHTYILLYIHTYITVPTTCLLPTSQVCCTPMEAYKHTQAVQEGLPRIDSGVILPDPTPADTHIPPTTKPVKSIKPLPTDENGEDATTPIGSSKSGGTKGRGWFPLVGWGAGRGFTLPTCLLPDMSVRSMTVCGVVMGCRVHVVSSICLILVLLCVVLCSYANCCYGFMFGQVVLLICSFLS